jgi:hypothetical protein
MVRLAQTQNRLRSTISRIGDHERDGSGQRRQAMKREQCDGARDTNDQVVPAFIHSVMGHPYTLRLHGEPLYSPFLLGQATKIYRKLPKLIASSGGLDLRLLRSSQQCRDRIYGKPPLLPKSRSVRALQEFRFRFAECGCFVKQGDSDRDGRASGVRNVNLTARLGPGHKISRNDAAPRTRGESTDANNN